MCLHKITDSCDDPKRKAIRYKVMRLTPRGGLELTVQHQGSYTTLPKKRWLRSRQDLVINSTTGIHYRPGFHVFVTKKAAKVYASSKLILGYPHVVVKVHVEGFICAGTQYGGVCIDVWNRLYIDGVVR